MSAPASGSGAGESAARSGAGGAAAQRDAALGARLLRTWRRLSPRPGGAWLFGRLLARMVPYSGTIRPRVVALEPGRAVIRIADRPRVRNHLRSVHAIALANLGELASGLAAAAAMPAGVRGIPVRITIDYLKKARGELTAVGTAVIPESLEGCEVRAEIRHAGGEVVAVVTVEWALERVA